LEQLGEKAIQGKVDIRIVDAMRSIRALEEGMEENNENLDVSDSEDPEFEERQTKRRRIEPSETGISSSGDLKFLDEEIKGETVVRSKGGVEVHDTGKATGFEKRGSKEQRKRPLTPDSLIFAADTLKNLGELAELKRKLGKSGFNSSSTHVQVQGLKGLNNYASDSE